ELGLTPRDLGFNPPAPLRRECLLGLPPLAAEPIAFPVELGEVGLGLPPAGLEVGEPRGQIALQGGPPPSGGPPAALLFGPRQPAQCFELRSELLALADALIAALAPVGEKGVEFGHHFPVPAASRSQVGRVFAGGRRV